MRLLVTIATVTTLLTAPAAACPGEICMPKLRDLAALKGSDPLLKMPDRARKPELDPMPWIWQVLRQDFYARMPRYDQRQFAMVLSPVVVASPTDTIPGVGVAGKF